MNILNHLGIENVLKAKEKISSIAFRYIVILNKNTTFSEVFEKMWISGFDPKDPDSGWGSRYHKTIFPLTGENVEIVPKDAKGYYLDSTCNASTWSNNAYSYTLFASENLKKVNR